MEDAEYRGYKDGEKFSNVNLELVKSLTAYACTNYGDSAYLRGLTNGSGLPAKQLAELKTDKPDWWDALESSAVDLLKGAQLMKIKDSAKRESVYDEIRADVSITYDDVKAMVKQANKRKPRAKKENTMDEIINLLRELSKRAKPFAVRDVVERANASPAEAQTCADLLRNQLEIVAAALAAREKAGK